MPGPSINISARLHTAGELDDGYRPSRSERIHPNWVRADPKQMTAIQGAHPNFGRWGAIGPDLSLLSGRMSITFAEAARMDPSRLRSSAHRLPCYRPGPAAAPGPGAANPPVGGL